MTAVLEEALALSPAFGGPLTRPYRIALLRHGDGFVVCAVHIDGLGGRGSGSYFRASDYKSAMRSWLDRCEIEFRERDERCWVQVGCGELVGSVADEAGVSE